MIPTHSILYSIADSLRSWRGTLKTTTFILYEVDEYITVKHITSEAPSIGNGSSAFFIYDEDIQENDTFFAWLREEGFHFWSSSKGWYSGATWKVCWIYVNLNSKLIARGIPGIRVTGGIGHHAITVDEFKAIYGIYKKYDTLSPLKFK